MLERYFTAGLILTVAILTPVMVVVQIIKTVF